MPTAAPPRGRPAVFVTRRLPGEAPIERLRAAAAVDLWPDDAPPPPETLASRAAPCRALLTMLTDRVDGALLDRCPELRIVSNMAVGYDNIDVQAASDRGVLVTNTPGVLTEATADLAFALLLAQARRLPEGEHAVRAGAWGTWHPTWLLGAEVHGMTLGIVGAGRIGQAVARRARAFDMQVVYTSRREHPEMPGAYLPLPDLLSRADAVSVHVPLTAETEHLIDRAAFRRMRREAIFVNTSRGGVVDQAALAEALTEGWIAGAAIDVTTPEPLPPDDPLLRAPHLLVTPHIGSATGRTRERMADLAVDAILDALAGRRPAHLLNPPAWEGGAG